jgi:hypothetical protein
MMNDSFFHISELFSAVLSFLFDIRAKYKQILLLNIGIFYIDKNYINYLLFFGLLTEFS